MQADRPPVTIHLSKEVVSIANPTEAGATYTSVRRAAHFVRTGRAELLEDGQLFFFDAATAIKRKKLQLEQRLLEAHRQGIVYWNGSDDPTSMHRPGEARS